MKGALKVIIKDAVETERSKQIEAQKAAEKAAEDKLNQSSGKSDNK